MPPAADSVARSAQRSAVGIVAVVQEDTPRDLCDLCDGRGAGASRGQPKIRKELQASTCKTLPPDVVRKTSIASSPSPSLAAGRVPAPGSTHSATAVAGRDWPSVGEL